MQLPRSATALLPIQPPIEPPIEPPIKPLITTVIAKMKFSLLTALSLPLLALALDKPLDVQVTQTAECSRKTQKGDKVNMHYRGTLESDGTEFDASYNRGTPFSFHLGKGQVIKGWDEGLLDMCPGEKRKLTVSSV